MASHSIQDKDQLLSKTQKALHNPALAIKILSPNTHLSPSFCSSHTHLLAALQKAKHSPTLLCNGTCLSLGCSLPGIHKAHFLTSLKSLLNSTLSTRSITFLIKRVLPLRFLLPCSIFVCINDDLPTYQINYISVMILCIVCPPDPTRL